MISDTAHYAMLVLYGLISYGIICSPAMPIILSLWTNTLLFIFITSLLFAIWSTIICYMKTGVYLRWTLWERVGYPLLTFEIEPTRHWSSWDEQWNNDNDAEIESPDTINGWNQALAWDQISNFDNTNDQPGVENWNAVEWENLEQNPLFLEAGVPIPNSVITALSLIDHFREEAPAWLTLHVPPIAFQSPPEETAPPTVEEEPENPFPEHEPIPSFDLNWPGDETGHPESDS